ncbi:MAG: hypothetical protein ACFFCV_15830 [Promethearchaeota archaeon]
MRENRKSERASGDQFWYFCIHNLISIFIFFFATTSLKIYSGNKVLLSEIFSREFSELVLLKVFPILILSSIGGRIIALIAINGFIKVKDRNKRVKRTSKKWSEYNKGINKLGLVFILTALITSIIYSLGLVGILQYAIFNENTLLTLIAVYIGLKIGTFYLVRWFIGSKF